MDYKENLFEPSLSSQGGLQTQPYDISKLFYVAFFGGIIPTTILAMKNAKWLNLEKNQIRLILSSGILALILKYGIVYSVILEYISIDGTISRWIYRIASVLLFLFYYWLMKTPFKQHMALHGETKPMLKDAIIWIIVGIVIELVFALIGGLIIASI